MSGTTGPGRTRRRLRAGLIGLAVLTAAACARDATPSGPAPSSGRIDTPARQTQGNQQSVGDFSIAFAQCMRAHGVPNFPDPNGHGGQLGPASGIDPTAPAFQSAINGRCRSVAPPAWVSSGAASSGGGS
jgi:hypothetical protein